MSEAVETRQDRARDELLRTLEVCGFNGPQFLERTGLPRPAWPTLFALMGFMAKAEGRVTGMDVRYAERTMKAMGINAAKRKRLIESFSTGKTWTSAQVGSFLRWRGKLQPSLPLRMLMLLTPLSYQDQRLSPNRIERCEQAGLALGLSQGSVDQILTRFQTKAWITRADAGPAAPSTFALACQVLGGKASDSLVILKSHYRRQVRQFHPDKRQHEKHSEVSEAAARDRLLELQKAWETVRKQHPDALR
jgi:DnaJ like chaperone protein